MHDTHDLAYVAGFVDTAWNFETVTVGTTAVVVTASSGDLVAHRAVITGVEEGAWQPIPTPRLQERMRG